MSFRSFGISLTAAALVWSAVSNVAPAQDAPGASVPVTESKQEADSDAQRKEERKDEKKVVRPVDPLTKLVEDAIAETSKRRLTAGMHTPWQIVHGILALRWEMALLTGNGSDEINAIEWIASGPSFDGMPLWEATPWGGRGHPFTRPYAFEGHPTQFMGYMTMADIPLDYKFKAGSKTITIRDIINDAKMQVRQGPEITWTLWAVSHYEDPEVEWINSAGEPWSIERMLRIQVAEPVTSGACGGTHGLFALSYARNMYFSTGKPLRGTWLEADQKVKRYILEARSLQNSDGSFSSNHFQGPGFSNDFGKRIATSGHQLEWLMVALPQSKLKEEWLRRAIECVAKDLIEHRKDSSDCGPLYHGLHALVIYRQRTVPGFQNPRPKNYLNLKQNDARLTDAKDKPIKPDGTAKPDVPKKPEGTGLPEGTGKPEGSGKAEAPNLPVKPKDEKEAEDGSARAIPIDLLKIVPVGKPPTIYINPVGPAPGPVLPAPAKS